MSRIVSIRTKLHDKEIVTACLEHMNCQVLSQETALRMNGAEKPVQILVHAPFGTLGFRKTDDGSYEVVCDDRILYRQSAFIKELTQQYAYRKILKEARAAGYHLVQEDIQADHSIKLVVRKW